MTELEKTLKENLFEAAEAARSKIKRMAHEHAGEKIPDWMWVEFQNTNAQFNALISVIRNSGLEDEYHEYVNERDPGSCVPLKTKSKHSSRQGGDKQPVRP